MMIISRTPFRISLFGGGTDYAPWVARYGGAVLGMAIDKYCYISLRKLPPFFDYKHRIVYSTVESVKEIADIRHPAVRGVFQDFGVTTGLELHHDGDLPARSGLGSSSSFTVGLISALAAMQGRMVHKRQLASEAIRIEQQVLAENVGCQDQIWAAYGGLNRIDFKTDGSFGVLPMIIPPHRRRQLVDSMMLVFTGLSRIASEIAKDQIDNLDKKEAQLVAMRRMVDIGESILCDEREPIERLGDLLHEAWMLKRTLSSKVTTPETDAIYEAARAAGASGGKLMGAGGGGFMIFIVKPSLKDKVREALRNLVHVKFDIDNQGSKIMVYEPGDDDNQI
jgi:D-glycero-alpha-D-manno-heptose-7-phosphate kinase